MTTEPKIQDQILTEVRDMLLEIMDGARTDIIHYAEAITNDMVSVAAEPDKAKRDELLAELVGQLKGVAEITRIRANEKTWKIIGRVVRLTVSSLVASIPSPRAGA